MHNPAVYENRCMTHTSLQLFNIIKEKKKKLLWNGQRQMLHLQTDTPPHTHTPPRAGLELLIRS